MPAPHSYARGEQQKSLLLCNQIPQNLRPPTRTALPQAWPRFQQELVSNCYLYDDRTFPPAEVGRKRVCENQDCEFSPEGTAESYPGLRRGLFSAVPAGLSLEMEFAYTLGGPTGSTSRKQRWSRPTGANSSYYAFDAVLDDEPIRQRAQGGGQGANHQSDVEGMGVIEQPPGDQRRQ